MTETPPGGRGDWRGMRYGRGVAMGYVKDSVTYARPMTKTRPLADRFWSKVERTEGGCWLWLGTTDRNGYGGIKEGGRDGRMLRVHRVAYELGVGEIQPKMEIDHLCRVRNCVNPEHLEQVTKAENMRRTRWKECLKGHADIGDLHGQRRCLTCARQNAVERTRRYRARRAAMASPSRSTSP